MKHVFRKKRCGFNAIELVVVVLVVFILLGLVVVSLDDLLFAKLSAFSTRGFPRDLIDLFAVDLQRNPDWRKLFHQAARASDNDYNPAEFHRKLKSHYRECARAGYVDELPVTMPPDTTKLHQFIDRLLTLNQAVARDVLEFSEAGDERGI